MQVFVYKKRCNNFLDVFRSHVDNSLRLLIPTPFAYPWGSKGAMTGSIQVPSSKLLSTRFEGNQPQQTLNMCGAMSSLGSLFGFPKAAGFKKNILISLAEWIGPTKVETYLHLPLNWSKQVEQHLTVCTTQLAQTRKGTEVQDFGE